MIRNFIDHFCSCDWFEIYSGHTSASCSRHPRKGRHFGAGNARQGVLGPRHRDGLEKQGHFSGEKP